VSRPRSSDSLSGVGPGFNPVLGFLGVATAVGLGEQNDTAGFQSRSGFSGCRDLARVTVKAHALVSIPFWVFWVSRPDQVGVRPPTGEVSIPFWVFWVSRPTFEPTRMDALNCFNPVLGFLGVATLGPALRERRPRRFNPVLGFLGVATSPATHYRTSIRCFNPVLGFLGVATYYVPHRGRHTMSFQSRSGFSGCRDAEERRARDGRGGVSIPFWVFWVSRPLVLTVVGFAFKLFQSRSGFSGCRDAAVSNE